MWEYLLHRLFAITPENGTEQAKLGGGVVAFTTWATIACFGTIAGIAWALSHDPYFALGLAGIAAAILVYFLNGTWKFADKHPDQAALGGASWLRWWETQQGQKDQPRLPSSPQISDPDQPIPANNPQTLIEPPDAE